jgi:hypothetical protein
MIESIAGLDSRLKDVMLNRGRLGLYFGITDYYGDPELLPEHLLTQAIAENPNPGVFDRETYLSVLRSYKNNPILPGNYHTDGIEKRMDVQGIFTILNQGVTGGDTLIRRRGINRKSPRPGEIDVTVKLKSAEGHAGLWVPSWGRTEVEHTPGPIQGGHRTIIVFGLDAIDPELEIEEGKTRLYYGSHNETLAWDRRSWVKNGPPCATPDRKLWHPCQ